MIRTLFVYGSLRSGSNNRWARLLRKNAALAGECSIGADLFRLGRYGALRLSTRGGRVHGELWRLHDASILPALDRYEGRAYRRVQVNVPQQGRAWVYEWRWPLPEWRRIAEGLANWMTISSAPAATVTEREDACVPRYSPAP